MTDLFVWFGFLRTVLNPAEATPQSRLRYGRASTFLVVMGSLFLLGAFAFALKWFVEFRAFGFAPTNPVSVETFSAADLEGPLREVRITGTLQLSDMIEASSASGGIDALIPLTTSDWKRGDPVTVYIQTHLFVYDQSIKTEGPRYELGLGHLELPSGTTGPVDVYLIAMDPRYPVEHPDTATPNAQLVEYMRPEWRSRRINQDIGGYFAVARIFGLMGLVIAGIGFYSRRRIRSVSDERDV